MIFWGFIDDELIRSFCLITTNFTPFFLKENLIKEKEVKLIHISSYELRFLYRYYYLRRNIMRCDIKDNANCFLIEKIFARIQNK